MRVSCIIVPSTMTTVVVMAEEKRVLADTSCLSSLNIANAMEILSNLALSYLILLILLVLGLHVKVLRVEFLVQAYVLVTLHVQ